MTITFRVDEVAFAKSKPATRTLDAHAGERLALGGDPAMRVLSAEGVHPLLAAVHAAFAEHRGLVLSPDAVWLTIVQGVAHHVRLHAEELRGRLVRHAGKKKIEIDWDGPFPSDPAALGTLLDRFRKAIGEEIGGGRARLLTCDFSTTGDVERVASEILLMDVVLPYFDFFVTCVCGIPELTLLGTVEDWQAIRARVDVLAELDLAWWTPSLAAIADKMVEAARGDPDVAFFRRIYKPKNAYAGDRVTGWIARLYPYVGDSGRYTQRNPMLKMPIDHEEPKPKGDEPFWMAMASGIRSSDVPPGGGSCLVTAKDVDGSRTDVVFEAGLAVEVDDAGRLVPRAVWTARRATASIHSVLESLAARDDVQLVPAAKTTSGGPAELVAFHDRVESAVLFVRGGAPWRILPRAEQVSIEVRSRSGARATSVKRVLDLPDGTFLAVDLGDRGIAFARLRADALGEEVRDHGLGRHSTTEVSEDIPLVGTSLAEILARALATNGALDFREAGKLVDWL